MGYIGQPPANKVVKTADIEDSAVTAAKIAADTIAAGDLAANSVDSSELVDGSIDTSHIGALQVTTAKIAADAVDGTKLADNAVNSEHYTDGSIDTAHIANSQITNALMADDAIGVAELSATGTASSSTFLRGDNAWTAVTSTTINNNADNRIITGSGTANTLEGESTLTYDGTNLDLGDSKKIRLGASQDLQIYHDGSDSVILDTGTGNLSLKTDGDFYVLNEAGTEVIIRGDADGAVKLYYDNALKLETVTGGATVTGTVTADGLDLGDSEKIRLGASQDLEIYHDGSNSIIADVGDGDLLIRAADDLRLQKLDGTNYLHCNENDSVELYFNGSKKLETTSGGVDVTGGLGVGTAKDLGVGIHVKSADTGASVNAHADELVIEGSRSGLTILSATDEEGSIYFGDSGDNDQGQIVYNQQVSYMKFVSNASERMRIHSGGNISIGTATAKGGLHVEHDAGNSTSIGTITVSTDNTGAATGIIFFDGSENNCGRISVLGSSNEIAIYGQSSDYRLKKDITDMDSSWELIKSLKPRKFKWKDKEELGYHNSFIAHELQEIIPKAVSGEKDAMTPEVLYTADDELPEGKNIGDVKEETKIDPQFIATAELTTYLTNALKEAITKIETLETANTDLATRITALENA